MSTSNIQPSVFTTSRTIVSFSVVCDNIKLFDNATFRVDSFDADNNVVNRQYLTMTNAQYLAWQNDDSYVINYVATTLGYTIAS
jgi:hypothetical protein